MAMSWHDVARVRPQFVQWIVQRFGPLPDGEVEREDYARFVNAYSEEVGA